MATAGTVPILIVGAGTTGLTLACTLARAGARVRIVDRLPEILPWCRATGIHSRTLEVFDDLGIADAVTEAGQAIRGSHQFANGERIAHERVPDVDSPYPFTHGLEQSKTEALLEALLERHGVKVERDCEFVAMDERLDGIRATLRHAGDREELVDTHWLVGCDGAHSRVRHLNHQRFPGEADPRQYVIGDVRVDPPLADDENYGFLSDDGSWFAFCLPEGRKLVIGDIPDLHDGSAESPSLERLQTIAAKRGMTSRLHDPRWRAYFRIHYRLGRRYRHGRTLLAGDAVHIHSPVGGMGMNTGIQDAYDLGWKLAHVVLGRAPVSLLDSYEKERQSVAADVIEMTRRMTERATGFAHLALPERDRIYYHAALSDAERLRAAEHIEQLDLDYRKSPICREHLGSHARGAQFSVGPHAGARAPDASPIERAGRELSLHQLLRGPHYTLLLFVRDGADAADRARLRAFAAEVTAAHGESIDVALVDGDAELGAGVVRDPARALRDRYGAGSECLYLIRPDGYVGYRSEPVSRADFRDYLDAVLIEGPAA